MSDELKKQVLDFFESKRGKKNRMTYKDVQKGMPDADKRAIKVALGDMTTDGTLKYWSSGSTTYIMLPDLYEELIKQGGEGHAED
jgi:hypothetical protein